MKILIIGTGYVGLVSGTCFAELGHEVVCVDNNLEKIAKLNSGEVPFFEPGLSELIAKNRKTNQLQFKTSLKEDVSSSDIIFIAVGTPPKENGQADLKYVFEVAKEIGQSLQNYNVIVTKSTVPIGASQKIKRIISQNYKGEFDVASCPEFLREGTAIKDFMNPERIVCGTENERAARVLRMVHEKLTCPKIETTIPSSELIKYAANAFLATKISFINEIANVCESVGADIDVVSYGMGLDSRIGHKFLKAGLGFGGSCLPKDVRALQNIAGENGYSSQLLKSVIDVNNNQRWRFYNNIKKALGNLISKEIAIWGLAFKGNTDDIRESVAIDLVVKLMEEGANVRVYDPKAINNAKKILGENSIIYSINALDACRNADVLIVATEWPEFLEVDLVQLRNVMKDQIVFDGRNLLDKNKLLNLGFKYYSIGR